VRGTKARPHHLAAGRFPSFTPQIPTTQLNFRSTCSTKEAYRAALRLQLKSTSLWPALCAVSTVSHRHVEAALTIWPDDGATSKQWEDEWLKSGWVRSALVIVGRQANASSYRVSSSRKLSSSASKLDLLKQASWRTFATSKTHLPLS
jgi:hypothetical protein